MSSLEQNNIDYKYINALSLDLRNFKRRRNDLYNFSCPLCGDSASNSRKARGYLFEKENKYYYKCHNCNASISFPLLLKKTNYQLYKRYIFESLSKDKNEYTEKNYSTDESLSKKYINLKKLSSCIKVTSLDEDSEAVQYLEKRKLSEYINLFYYTNDFSKTVKSIFSDRYDIKEQDSRLIIPIYNKDKELIGIQGRSFKIKTELRYVTLKFDDKRICYGLDKVNTNYKVYVTEGVLDAIFLKNSLASLNSSLSSVLELFDDVDESKFIFVFDNEPRNKNIIEEMRRTIDSGLNVVVWPTSIESKDINDMIISGIHKDDIQKIIEENTFSGMLAKLKFERWRKL